MSHLNIAFGNDSITVASTSMTSSLTFLTRSFLFFRSFPFALASFLPKRVVLLTAVRSWDKNVGPLDDVVDCILKFE